MAQLRRRSGRCRTRPPSKERARQKGSQDTHDGFARQDTHDGGADSGHPPQRARQKCSPDRHPPPLGNSIQRTRSIPTEQCSGRHAARKEQNPAESRHPPRWLASGDVRGGVELVRRARKGLARHPPPLGNSIQRTRSTELDPQNSIHTHRAVLGASRGAEGDLRAAAEVGGEVHQVFGA